MYISVKNINGYASKVIQASRENPELFKGVINSAEKSFKEAIANYGGYNVKSGINFTPTCFSVSRQDALSLAMAGEKLHTLIEKVFDALAEGDSLVVDHFKHHSRFFDLLKRNRKRWQAYGRYDFIINACGRFKFCETNTSGGAGFWLNHYYNQISLDATNTLHMDNNIPRIKQEYENFLFFANKAIEMEKEMSIAPGLVAILYDESNFIDPTSQVSSELNMLKKTFEQLNREVVVLDVRELNCQTGFLYYQGKKISITFNKFRLAGLKGAWGDDYRDKYNAFVKGVISGNFLPINDVSSLVIGEDKGIFALLTDSKFHYLFNQVEIAFIQDYVLWTRRLFQFDSQNPNKLSDIFEYALNNKDHLVLKPSNERRGYGVILGSECNDEEWYKLLVDYSKISSVLQEKHEPIKIDTLMLVNDVLDISKKYHIGSMYIIDGAFSGLLSRLSDANVSNISAGGVTQPVRIFDETAH